MANNRAKRQPMYIIVRSLETEEIIIRQEISLRKAARWWREVAPYYGSNVRFYGYYANGSSFGFPDAWSENEWRRVIHDTFED